MSLLAKHNLEVATFVEVCHKLAANLYVTAHNGNLAWRLTEQVILITPTQVNKGDLTSADMVFISPDGKVLEGRREPTGEAPMYLTFFRERPDVAAVIHSHPPAASAVAVTKGPNWLARPIFTEAVTEIGPVPVAPYAEPLTQQLADNFLPYLARYNAFLMANHGLVLMTPRDIRWALMLTELLESVASSILSALRLGPIKELSKQDLRDLDHFLKVRNLPLPGAPGVNESLVDLYFQ